MTDHDGSGGSATVTPLARKYGREIITQTINNYPDLAGIGITLGDRMTNIREGSSNLKGEICRQKVVARFPAWLIFV